MIFGKIDKLVRNFWNDFRVNIVHEYNFKLVMTLSKVVFYQHDFVNFIKQKSYDILTILIKSEINFR